MHATMDHSAWFLTAVSLSCLVAVVSADRVSDPHQLAAEAAAVPRLSSQNKHDRSLQQQQQQVGTTVYNSMGTTGTTVWSNVNVVTGDVSGADATVSAVHISQTSASTAAAADAAAAPSPLPPEWREIVDPNTGRPYYYNVDTREVTWDRPSGAATVTTVVDDPDLEAKETAVIDADFEDEEENLASVAEELPGDEVAELDEGNVEKNTSNQPTKMISCMDWIPTDPATPPSSFTHCYDGTYQYTLTSYSRPKRCSSQYFNLGQYNYQQILAGNTDGASPSDEWTVCAHWFNLHAGLPTAFEDLSVPNLYLLSKIGNGGTYDLPACTGDCDSDDECQPGLFCLVRNRQSLPTVAFCGGLAEDKIDYCIPERYRDADFAREDYLEELEDSIKEGIGVEEPDGGMDGTDEAGEIGEAVVTPAEESILVQDDTSAQANPLDATSEGVDEIVEDILTEDTVQENSIAGDESLTPEVPTNDPGPAIEDTRGREKEGTSNELAYDAPEDRPQKTFPIEVALPSFFMAIEVRIRNPNKRQLLLEDPSRIAEAVIDADALRDALQNVLQASIATLDDRLWGVNVQATNIDTVALTLNDGRLANREFFSVHGQAIFLVLDTEDGTEITALDANPLPDEEQLRAAIELALQKNTLLAEFSEFKGRTKLPRAINVGASFMDGTPISGSFEDAETEAIADSETIVSSMSSDEEGSFFSTLTISAIAGACGAMIFVVGGAAIYSRRRALRMSKEEHLSPRSRSFPQKDANKLFTFGGGDADPDAVKQTFSGDTHPISPTSSAKEEEKKQKMEEYFEKLENVESQPEPSIDGESNFDFDTSQYSESECGMTMSEWSVNDIGKDHVQLTDKQTLKPEKSIARMGKRMRQALGHAPTYAESEADISYAETDNASLLGDFRLGSVLSDGMSDLGTNTNELGGITEEVDGEYTPAKSNKSDFSALWKTRIEKDESHMPPAVEEVSPAKSIEDSVLGVSLSETNRVIRRMKEENATNSFLDVSHHAPRFDIENASTDSEAEDESMLFHTRPAPPMNSATILEVDESNNSDVGSRSSKGAPSSTTKSAAGSIIGSILGNDEKKPEDTLDSLRYLDNSMAANGSRKTSGDQIVDDDVSNAETSVDTADDILRGKYTNLLSEVASSTGSTGTADDEPRFFQLDMPAAYRTEHTNETGGGVDDESVGGSSMYSM